MSGLLVLIAALGSSALTGAVAFGLEWWRSNRAGKAAQAERRSRAYSMLLTRSIIIAHLAADLHTVMEVRSGMKEGINVTLRFQGEKWTQQQLDQWQDELRGLAEARKRLGGVARRETGVEVADLFASNESINP